MPPLPLLLVAASVGLSNLAAAIGIGFGGVTARTRIRVGLVFGVFEAGMPIVGLVVGAGVASGIGHAARWIGAVVLIVIGLKMLASHYVYIPTEWALTIVLLVLGASILASLLNPRKQRANTL